MRLLILGSGHVGAAAAAIAAERDAFTHVVCADIVGDRAQAAAEATDEDRFLATAVDATDKAAVAALLRSDRIECVLNAGDPLLNAPVLRAARAAGATYVDLAIDDAAFGAHDDWRSAGQLALVGMGASPGLTDVFARHARDRMFTTIEEVGVRVAGRPAGDHRRAGAAPQTFEFPAGIGAVECVAVEHDEERLVPRVIDCERVTVRYGETAGPVCVGTYVTGTGTDGRPRRTYLHHVVEGEDAAARQTAACAVAALELLADGSWTGAGVLGPEAFDAEPYLERLAEYGAPHAVEER